MKLKQLTRVIRAAEDLLNAIGYDHKNGCGRMPGQLRTISAHGDVTQKGSEGPCRDEWMAFIRKCDALEGAKQDLEMSDVSLPTDTHVCLGPEHCDFVR